MKIVAFINGEGIRKEQYDKLRSLVQWERNFPKGACFHVAAFDEKGARVVDIWESEAELNEFFEKRLAPNFDKAGISGAQIKKEIFPMHAVFVPDRNLWTPPLEPSTAIDI